MVGFNTNDFRSQIEIVTAGKFLYRRFSSVLFERWLIRANGRWHEMNVGPKRSRRCPWSAPGRALVQTDLVALRNTANSENGGDGAPGSSNLAQASAPSFLSTPH